MVEKIQINLIPAEYRTNERTLSFDTKIILPAIISLTMVGIALCWSFFLSIRISLEKEKIANIEREIDVNKTIQEEIKKLETLQSEMKNKVAGLKSVNVNRTKWISAFELYASVLPENTWLTRIEEMADGVTIAIDGMTEADAEVGLIMKRLSDSPMSSNAVLVEMRDAGNDGRLKSFTIQHSLLRVEEN